MLNEADILLALRDCYDPTLPCNIVDLGQVRSILITPDLEAPGTNIPGVPQKHRIKIEITPTQTSEDAQAQLQAQIINRLAGLETISQTEVIVRDYPAWSPQQITPTGRRTLGLDGNPNLVQIR
jgi:metal-sulfur cluster biosynthetic enzyme